VRAVAVMRPVSVLVILVIVCLPVGARRCGR
jgi:hypothetical protein